MAREITNKKIIQILESLDIEYWTAGNNVSLDSVNIQCIFCDDHSNHLGIFFPSGIFHCWRCNKKGYFEIIIQKIKQCTYEEAEKLITEGQSFKKSAIEQIKEKMQPKLNTTENKKFEIKGIALPKEAKPVGFFKGEALLENFLRRRKLTLETCTKYNCYVCEGGEYCSRMIIPVFFQGIMVSFQAADMTKTSATKYKSLGNVDLNSFLYNYDNITDRIIITEGVFDCWRVGKDAVATFGTHITERQLDLIEQKKPKEIILAWDNDAYVKALKQARKLPRCSKIRVLRLPRGEDPDSLGSEAMWRLIDAAN
ncbi:MAG: toprim domain-containing protein [Methanogenium sp.]|jgi:hypothetical protein